jgi:hypothetical protein
VWGKFIPPRFLDCSYCNLVIRRPPGLYVYSDRTFKVANRKSFLRLLLIFIVLICPIFSSFSFVIRVCLRGRVISPSHNLLTSESPVLVVTFRSYRCSQTPHWDQTLCVAAPLEIRRYYKVLKNSLINFKKSSVEIQEA